MLELKRLRPAGSKDSKGQDAEIASVATVLAGTWMAVCQPGQDSVHACERLVWFTATTTSSPPGFSNAAKVSLLVDPSSQPMRTAPRRTKRVICPISQYSGM